MAKPKRTPLQIKQDRLRITEMYLQGNYQSEIAKKIGLSQQQISYDLKVIQKEWQKTTTITIDEHRTKEIARINNLERVYWQEWEESKQELKTKTIKSKDNNAEKILKSEERRGDPRYLQGIQWCIEQRCKILGIYQKADISDGLVINLISSQQVNLDNC